MEAMNTLSVCEAIARIRGDAVIVATMGSMLAFDRLGANEGRINSVPLMGGAASLGLGIALAHPRRKVLVVDGDASLLMQLGGLAGVATQQPRNLYHFVVNNGVQFAGIYNLDIAGKGRVDFAGLARAAGYALAKRYNELEPFSKDLPGILSVDGPTFVEVVVQPEKSVFGKEHPQTEVPDRQFTRMGDEARALGAWLQRT